ncbi:MAG: restriction endonuclease subunit S [Clostridiaceae bacterium]
MDKKKIGEICKISSGGTPSRQNNEYYENGTIKWIKTGDLKNKNLYDASEYITEDALNNSSAKLFPPETVLIAMYGATIGACSILKTEAASNQACAALLPSEYYIPEFMYYYITFRKKDIVSKAVGGAQPNISAGFLKEYEIPLPPLETQKKIVEALDKAQVLIDARKEQIRLMDELVKSRFVEMFGDPNDVNSKWEKIKLGDLCTIVRGGSPRPIENFLGGNIPWIKIGDATQGDDIYLHSTKEHIIEEGIKKSRYIKKNSMIFANCGVSLGFARIITFDGCIHDGWLAFHDIDSSLNDIFLLKSLNMCTDYFRKTAPDGTQPNLNTGIMKTYNQIVPPLELQNEFVEFFKYVDKSKSELQTNLNELIITQQALMQQYFG